MKALEVIGRIPLHAPASIACCERQELFVTTMFLFTRPYGGQPGCVSIMRQAILWKTKICSV
jgi:hypothetical protein